MSRRDLERLEEDLNVELALSDAALPANRGPLFETFDPTDPLATDPTEVIRYEVGLSELRAAVMELEGSADTEPT